MILTNSLAQSALFSVTLIIMVLGIIGTAIPLLPGTIVVWLATLGFAVFTDWALLTPFWFVMITVIALITGSADWWLPMLGANLAGGSRWSGLVGSIGGLIGFFAFNFIGSLVGYALGVISAEYYRLREWRPALRSSLGGLAGVGMANVVQFIGAIMILSLFIWRVLGRMNSTL